MGDTKGGAAAAPRHGFATLAVQAGAEPHAGTGARTIPIFQTNGFVFDDLQHGADLFGLRKSGFTYSRGSNPTTAAFERRIAALEGGTSGIAIGSGQSALLVILLTLCATGDSFVASRQLFGGSLGLVRRLDKRLGIAVAFADPTPESIAAAIDEGTRAVVIESIVNPTGLVVDVPGIAAICRERRIPLVVDNTLATPFLMRPIELGADIVFHSASKFLVGSGTAIGGAIVDGGSFDWRSDPRFPLISEPWTDYDDILLTEAFPRAAFAAAARLLGLRELGPGLAPMSAFLILTGIETLPLRMRRHCEIGLAVARHLASHTAVESVSHPLLAEGGAKRLAERLCPEGIGSIFLATLKGGEEAAARFLSRVKLFSHLVNIGESRSLVCHPASTTHKQLSAAERAAFGISDGTIRFSVGIEDAADLIADLDQALAA